MFRVTGQKDIDTFDAIWRKKLPYGRGIVTASGIAYEVLFNREYETIARRLGKQPAKRVNCERDFYEYKNFLYYDSTNPNHDVHTLAVCVDVLAAFLLGENVDKFFT